jgi:glc operon protein GlcG
MEEYKTIGLEEARMIVGAAIAEAEKTEGLPMAVAVVDRHGIPLCIARMDGGFSLASRVCVTKCQSALEVLRDTKTARENFDSRPEKLKSYEFSSYLFTCIPGGCLLKTRDGSIVGAVGSSGRTPQGDEAISQAGVRAFEESQYFNF